MKKILCALAIIVAFVCVFTACEKTQSPTISISEDGYWVIDGEKTDVKAKGEKGDKGDVSVTNENPQGLAFCLKDDGTYAVEIGDAKYLSKIEIPATYNGKAVTEVGRFCDDNENNILQEIIIPNSVTTIGEHAFETCTNLTSVTIPDSVTAIGEHAFEACTNLTSVTIPDSVTTIGEHAFEACTNLTSVTIPDSVTAIGEHAFEACTNLTSVTIPDSVTTIGEHAFEACTNLTSVTIPDSVTTIGEYAFEVCTNLTSVYIYDLAAWCNIDFANYSANPLCYAKNLYFIKDGTPELITDLVIPNTVTTINKLAFYNCDNFTSVTIPDSVTTIDYSAFFDCDGLTSITIPDSVTSIGDYAFYGCNNLEGVTIGDSVTGIGELAFYGCTNLTSVTFANPNGWWYSHDANATSGITISASDLSNSFTAAQYLKNSYYYSSYGNCYWFRTE